MWRGEFSCKQWMLAEDPATSSQNPPLIAIGKYWEWTFNPTLLHNISTQLKTITLVIQADKCMDFLPVAEVMPAAAAHHAHDDVTQLPDFSLRLGRWPPESGWWGKAAEFEPFCFMLHPQSSWETRACNHHCWCPNFPKLYRCTSDRAQSSSEHDWKRGWKKIHSW